MCGTCIGAEVDITAPIEPEGEINQCRGCGRYLTLTGSWQAAEPESFDLLSLCLKRIRGLRKLKMVDAKFIWTEPHSRRLRLRITVEGEALSRATIRQTCDVVLRVTVRPSAPCTRAPWTRALGVGGREGVSARPCSSLTRAPRRRTRCATTAAASAATRPGAPWSRCDSGSATSGP